MEKKIKRTKEKRERHTPKFGPNGTKHGIKSERKTRDNHENRRKNEAWEVSAKINKNLIASKVLGVPKINRYKEALI